SPAHPRVKHPQYRRQRLWCIRDRRAALGRALGRVRVPWPVNLVLLDVAQDLVGDWMREKVRPFYRREDR
ncbi:enhanced serine sensitivity protein SseB C-terminal domain-containing protein, partial [Streptomyces californicus]|uniref:enhanced serine sensitivity protein SseB C-terminal domain-containing protein n=1 Tax=Streptomyces californicus TaxID=67351 RepID=UPI0036B805A5